MKVAELKKEFSTETLPEKCEIKNSGRPTPNLNIVQVQKECKSRGSFKRKFDKGVYDKTLWLCGCEEKNSFFLFRVLDVWW